jgi:hypothetical protein
MEASEKACREAVGEVVGGLRRELDPSAERGGDDGEGVPTAMRGPQLAAAVTAIRTPVVAVEVEVRSLAAAGQDMAQVVGHAFLPLSPLTPPAASNSSMPSRRKRR